MYTRARAVLSGLLVSVALLACCLYIYAAESAGFKSLFEELYDAGLIAVNQLEKQLGLDKDAARPSTSGSGATTASSSRASSTQEPARYTPQALISC